MPFPHLADFLSPQAEHHNSVCLHLDKIVLFPIFLNVAGRNPKPLPLLLKLLTEHSRRTHSQTCPPPQRKVLGETFIFGEQLAEAWWPPVAA